MKLLYKTDYMKIRIDSINDVCDYPELIGKVFEISMDWPHTSDSWAFVKTEHKLPTFFMIHKRLTTIVE